MISNINHFENLNRLPVGSEAAKKVFTEQLDDLRRRLDNLDLAARRKRVLIYR